ncbi:MAG: PhoH family protein [Clostridia bacterium]|nr:PhoH family protein [Clostridia bacterium]MBR2296588.1 PhoH family protein [Clostridia bacterium]
MAERMFNTASPDITSAIFGPFDIHISAVSNAFNVKIVNRPANNEIGDCITISGDEDNVKKAYEVLLYLNKMATLNTIITDQSVDYAISMVQESRTAELNELDGDCFLVSAKGRPIKAKTLGQKKYINAIKTNTITVGIGPAGTGKTFLAVAMAVKALRDKEVSRIILTRPAVEAGERLGFLPGDLQSKIDPYLRPLYDSLYEMLGFENCAKYIERMTIEIAPLAYMRGRTLDDSFIILDEAQNTTPEQMKMFLTRLGIGSKIVVTGDLTQTDLPDGKKSGLAEAVKILRDVEGISIHNFTDKDVVRHKLVQKIILAYDKYERERRERNKK